MIEQCLLISLKWLRYYLDFCEKYQFSAGQPTSLLQFIRKLQEKKQTEAQQQQTCHAITLYHEILQHQESHQAINAARPKATHGSNPTEVRQPRISEHPQPMALIHASLPSPVPAQPLCREISTSQKTFASQGASWKAEYSRLSNEIKLRQWASAHTFRHCFVSHLLQADYDIRTIQELLGHSDRRTTMIYTHTVKSVAVKEARSPLDL